MRVFPPYKTVDLILLALPLGLLAVGCQGLTPYNLDGRLDTADTDGSADTGDSGDSGVDSGDSGDDTETGTELKPLVVDAVSPAHGSDAGGLVVELTGGPFDNSAQVYFGDKKAKVVSSGTSWIQVEVPSNTAGYQHVRVVTDTHQGRLDNGFLYWPDGTGRTGVLGSFEHFQYVGSYWADGTPAPEAGASVFFIAPASIEWWQLFGRGFNQCSSNYEYSGTDVEVFQPDVTRFTLKRGSAAAVNLFQGDGTPENPEYVFGTQGNVASSFANSANYNLESAGTDEWPEFVLEGAVQTPSSFQVTSPVINTSTAPDITRSNFRVAWTGGGGDYVLLRALRYNSTGTPLEEVTCVLDDTGSFTIPSNVWAGWSAGSQITLLVGRVKESTGTVPFNGSNSGMVGVQWIIGAGFSR
jgi:hypothetical protein